MIKILLAQLNFLVGDIEGNCEKILHHIDLARDEYDADCVVFSELALIAYPPEDLLFRGRINARIIQAVERIIVASENISVIVGVPWLEEQKLYNSALVIQQGKLIQKYHKIKLPNYNVFDEKRYFSAGDKPCVFDMKGIQLGVTICEDVWDQTPIKLSKQAGAELIVNINASPFHLDKIKQRELEIANRVGESDLPILYLNQVGGQDELVFDGSSFVVNCHGEKIASAKFCREDLLLIGVDTKSKEPTNLIKNNAITSSEIANTYDVLEYGLKQYIEKNNFNGGLIGLSGGIDSALVLALAVDALGADRVHAVMMPSRYTSKMSLDDAAQLAENLGVKYSVIEIDSLVAGVENSLSKIFEGQQKDTTEENIQARIRGVLLMAISNKFGNMVISTGNKSEMAVGYATLYGDMAGGFAPLKDVPKMLVYELSRYRNSLSQVIPQRIIERPPSAELAPNQVDQDNLPPYNVLDRILQFFIEEDMPRNQIIAQGFSEEDVSKVIKLVFQNEYKRRQAPPGIKITQRAFGKDRRYPITSGVIKYLQDN